MSDKKVAIIYYSGTGGTKLVAQLVGELLSTALDPSVTGIEEARAGERAAEADLLVLLYPTFYLAPPPSMREFIENLGPFDPPKEAYVVTTCELYSENSIRRLSLMLKKRGVIVAGSKVVHAPGSDATCVFPSSLVPWLYRFERGFPEKLRAIAGEIETVAGAFGISESIPSLKWYTPFTQLLQILFFNRFDLWRYRMRAMSERCARCGACVRRCGRGAWFMGEEGPVHDGERCELCARCLHLCPENAIFLIGALKDNRRLNSRLYAELRAQARGSLGLDRGGEAK
jgi:ferredoxin/flavodoxin